MPRSLLRVLSFPAATVVTGCLALPIPHHVVPTGHVYGRIVDGVTHQPVAGARLELAEQERTTGAEGRFEFTPNSEWHFVYMVILEPEELNCMDNLDLTKQGYRIESVRVKNCPLTLGDGDTKNATIADDVGDIYLTPDKGPVGH
jgi:hypothetical protein